MKTYLGITALLAMAFVTFCVLSVTVFLGSVSGWAFLLALTCLFVVSYVNTAVNLPETSPSWLVHCVSFVSSAVLCFVLFWVGFFAMSRISQP